MKGVQELDNMSVHFWDTPHKTGLWVISVQILRALREHLQQTSTPIFHVPSVIKSTHGKQISADIWGLNVERNLIYNVHIAHTLQTGSLVYRNTLGDVTKTCLISGRYLYKGISTENHPRLITRDRGLLETYQKVIMRVQGLVWGCLRATVLPEHLQKALKTCKFQLDTEKWQRVCDWFNWQTAEFTEKGSPEFKPLICVSICSTDKLLKPKMRIFVIMWLGCIYGNL